MPVQQAFIGSFPIRVHEPFSYKVTISQFLSVNRRQPRVRLTCVAQQPPQEKPRTGIRPKQSLGQNFLRDRNIVRRIVASFCEARRERCPDSRVVEVGPGLGALTGALAEEFPDITGIEIDRRAIAHLQDHFPNVSVLHEDVLQTDWAQLASSFGSPLSVIGNMPYNIVSQILLSLFEAPSGAVELAFVMMQREVAQRLVAPTRCKSYGILSVVAQLYAKPTIMFSVPPTAFYPIPDVTSCMVRLDFEPCQNFNPANLTLARGLRQVLKAAFGQRRKVLRNSLKSLCQQLNIQLPDFYSTKRPEELTPIEFVHLTEFLFAQSLADASKDYNFSEDRSVWRTRKQT